MKFTGLDALQRKLEQLSENAQELHGTHQVPLDEVFPPAFMRQHSTVTDFATFCQAAGLDVSSDAAFASMPEDQLDAAVAQLTQFATWDEMKRAGAADWAQRRLFKGFNG